MKSLLDLDASAMFAEAVCDHHGLTREEWATLLEQGSRALRAMREEHAKGGLAFLDLPHHREEASRILAWAEARREEIADLVVLGIGGSALGTIALAEALGEPPRPGTGAVRSEAAGGDTRRPRLHVLDTVDPEAVLPVLDGVDLSRSLFLSISKSGGTPETLAQTLLAVDRLRREAGKGWNRHLAVITDPEKGPLRAFALAHDLETFAVPPGVGGRFSVLSAVGLVPAALLGLDILGLLEGAASQDLPARGESAAEVAAYAPAAYGILQHGLATAKGCRIHVLMPYANALYRVADWYRQLLAESLGKKRTLDGRKVEVTPTPVKAVGPTDQHSQVQLYMEGSHDKTVTFLAVRHPRCDRAIPARPRSSPTRDPSSRGSPCTSSSRRSSRARARRSRRPTGRTAGSRWTASRPARSAPCSSSSRSRWRWRAGSWGSTPSISRGSSGARCARARSWPRGGPLPAHDPSVGAVFEDVLSPESQLGSDPQEAVDLRLGQRPHLAQGLGVVGDARGVLDLLEILEGLRDVARDRDDPMALEDDRIRAADELADRLGEIVGRGRSIGRRGDRSERDDDLGDDAERERQPRDREGGRHRRMGVDDCADVRPLAVGEKVHLHLGGRPGRLSPKRIPLEVRPHEILGMKEPLVRPRRGHEEAPIGKSEADVAVGGGDVSLAVHPSPDLDDGPAKLRLVPAGREAPHRDLRRIPPARVCPPRPLAPILVSPTLTPCLLALTPSSCARPGGPPVRGGGSAPRERDRGPRRRSPGPRRRPRRRTPRPPCAAAPGARP